MIRYEDVKDDLKKHSRETPDIDISNRELRDWLLLRVLHSIAADLDTIAYAARELTKLPRKRGPKK
jgi:hypothetical protein